MLTKFILSIVLFYSVAFAADNHVGDLFNFEPNVGACGFLNNTKQIVASVPSTFFTTYPGATANPNENPLCQKSVYIFKGTKNLTAPIVDYFIAANAENDVGLSAPGFVTFGSLDLGVIPNVTWTVV